MLKKLIAVLCIFALLFSFSSCKMPERQDWSQLVYMTDRELKDMKLNIEDSFFYDGKWFLSVPVTAEENILITASEDENLLITSFAVTVLNNGAEGTAEVFLNITEAVLKAFSGTDNAGKLIEGVGLFAEDRLFSEETFFFESGRYSVSFFNAPEGSSLMAELLY